MRGCRDGGTSTNERPAAPPGNYEPVTPTAQFRGRLAAQALRYYPQHPDREGRPCMKLRSEIVIDADRETVWAAFTRRDNVRRWQPDIKSMKLVSGEHLEPGAESLVVYREDGRDYTIVEHVTERRDPDFIALRGETVSGTATSVNHFESIDGGRTRWVVYVNHSFRGLMRIVGPFFKNRAMRRIDRHMQQFKLMVESDAQAGTQ